MKFKINLNLIGVVIIIVGFGFSAARVFTLSAESSGVGLSGKRVVRLAHWQLEPGYREAMQWVMDEYNNLPHVKEQGIEMRQLAITERFYTQVLNVHIISGTAPDITERGKSDLMQGSFTAKYFEPISTLAEKPNPYNADEYLDHYADHPEYQNYIDRVPDDLRRALQDRPWRETYVDGMRGGWDQALQEFYSVPTSFFGPNRLYYNKTLMARSKETLRTAIQQEPRPSWLESVLAEGFLKLDAPTLAWLETDEPPETYGRLILICEAMQAYGEANGLDKLVPISGSSYSLGSFEQGYLLAFTNRMAAPLDRDLSSDVTAQEAYLGWLAGEWDFDLPQFQAYFDCIAKIADYFPVGFVSLDREQANRRFVLGNAGFIVTGGWDAGSLHEGASNAADPFEVGAYRLPLPGPGEKWHDLVSARGSEAGTNAGAAYTIYQQSANKDVAYDFLQFFGSYSINQIMNYKASWIPVIIGTRPRERMLPFVPDPEGVFGWQWINPSQGTSFITSGYRGDGLYLFLAGQKTKQEMTDGFRDLYEDPRNGLNRVLYQRWDGQVDQIRSGERQLAAVEARLNFDLATNPEAMKGNLQFLRYKSCYNRGDQLTQFMWAEQYPDTPFPEF